MPRRISPSASSSSRRSFWTARHSCMAARSERMARLRRRLISMTFMRRARPTISESGLAPSVPGLAPTTCDIGMKALTPSTLASRPPLLKPVISASKISPLSKRSWSTRQPCSPRARSMESSTWPSSVSGWSTKTSSFSPISILPSGSEPIECISWVGMMPSDLEPMSTRSMSTPSRSMLMTRPSTTSPRRSWRGSGASPEASSSSISTISGSEPAGIAAVGSAGAGSGGAAGGDSGGGAVAAGVAAAGAALAGGSDCSDVGGVVKLLWASRCGLRSRRPAERSRQRARSYHAALARPLRGIAQWRCAPQLRAGLSAAGGRALRRRRAGVGSSRALAEQ